MTPSGSRSPSEVVESLSPQHRWTQPSTHCSSDPGCRKWGAGGLEIIGGAFQPQVLYNLKVQLGNIRVFNYKMYVSCIQLFYLDSKLPQQKKYKPSKQLQEINTENHRSALQLNHSFFKSNCISTLKVSWKRPFILCHFSFPNPVQ